MLSVKVQLVRQQSAVHVKALAFACVSIYGISRYMMSSFTIKSFFPFQGFNRSFSECIKFI